MVRQADGNPARVLVVDDDSIVRRALSTMLQSDEFVVRECGSAEEACQVLEGTAVDVVMTDVRMGGMDGLALLEHIKRTRPGVEVIVMTAYGTFADAVRATRLGAFDYVTKPFQDIDACINRVRQAARIKRLRDENEALRKEIELTGPPGILETKSPRMREVIDQIRRVAKVDATVLITGPTGAGKTAIARTIHELSRRRDKEFVHVDCGITEAQLMESKLFGHTRGAFTNAVSDKQGLFRVADGGTIFLDEIGNMHLEVQAKLLRVLNDGTFRPIGGERDLKADVRVISATNEVLPERVEGGAFRQDLYHRLNVVEIDLPALNDRREDIPMLAMTIVRQLARRHESPVRTISPECMDRLRAHDWTGNIRELENTLERAVIFESSEELTIDSLPPKLRGGTPVPRLVVPGRAVTVDVEKPWREAIDEAETAIRALYLRTVLDRYDGNMSQAARHARADVSNFRRDVKRYLRRRR